MASCGCTNPRSSCFGPCNVSIPYPEQETVHMFSSGTVKTLRPNSCLPFFAFSAIDVPVGVVTACAFCDNVVAEF